MSIKQLIAERGEKELEKQVNEMNKKHVIPSGLCKDNNKRKKLTEAEKKAKRKAYNAEYWKKKSAKMKQEAAAEFKKIELGRELTATALLDQTAKADAGKPKISLVPMQILSDIAEVREYGCRKYHDPNNWKRVELERYIDATFRHLIAFTKDLQGKDTESGIKHYKHVACNVAFICEMMEGRK